MRPGRPDLSRYAAHFDVPGAAAGGLSVTFLGVATLLFRDRHVAVLTDGFFSRPGLLRATAGRIAPDVARIEAALAGAGIGRLDAVAPVHSHYDHAMDAAVVAHRTGARLLGGRSTAHIGRGGGLTESRIGTVRSGDEVFCGEFALTFVASAHSEPDRFPGAIETPVVPPVRWTAYRCGEAWSILVAHASGRTALVQGSAGFVPGALAGRRAEVAYLGAAQLGARETGYLEAYWTHTVRAVGARRVVLIHWDDFFRPLDRPLKALPYAVDDLDRTLRVLRRLAATDGVALHFPRVWRRENPWRGLDLDTGRACAGPL